MANTAKQEINDFLASNEAGIRSQFTKATLQNAAETIFTANGLPCPVVVVEKEGQAFLLNREIAFSDHAQ